ncbi:hypothetical protein AWB67_05924 [Caballeronia terrestris]|uniref:Uncharacterized protein n=1 Tax=Caballeronia terrestris TaxID=1226301 RepID=A0A158KLX7_9BURK|nr:hypothetical protein [Caballeronia terrestris]SAL81733.1 hypothetical protein AWB67_05924 [Caballeronia terrestris]
MDAELVRGVGATAGIAGVALGTLVQILRPMLQKRVLGTMSKANAYKLLRTIVVGCLIIAVAGIAAWLISPLSSGGNDNIKDAPKINQSTRGECSPALSGVAGNVTINGNCGK